MKYTEEIRDLFSVSDDYYLAHCISADFALGAGIVVEFNKRFDMRAVLKENYLGYLAYYNKYHLRGDCILEDRVLNLITKSRCFHKPTLQSM